jgi:hypothetical protein
MSAAIGEPGKYLLQLPSSLVDEQEKFLRSEGFIPIDESTCTLKNNVLVY